MGAHPALPRRRGYSCKFCPVPGSEVERLEESMVLGVEAFLAERGVGSAGFEQNIIIRADGNELLTTTPTVWW